MNNNKNNKRPKRTRTPQVVTATKWRAIVGAHLGTPFAKVYSTKVFPLRAQAMSWANYELKETVNAGWNEIQINVAPELEVRL